MKEKRILIYGWFGHENLGDELILKSIIQLIKEIDESFIIDVMAPKTNNIKKYHPEVNLVSTYIDTRIKSILRLIKYNPINVIRNVIRADFLVIGSGGALSDWNPTSTKTLFFLIKLFKKVLKKPVIMLGVGAGPIERRESKVYFENILKYVDQISLRDKESYDLLKEIGLKNIVLTNDVVFDLHPLYLNQYSPKIPKYNIGIVIAPLILNSNNKIERYKNSIIEYIKKCKKAGYNITLIPFQYEYDIEFLKDISSCTDTEIFEEGKKNTWGIIDEINKQDIIIGMRFHSVILSLMLNKPVLPIIYHNKVYSVAKEFEILNLSQEVGDGSNWLNKDINSEKLFNDTKYIFENLEVFKAKILDILSNKHSMKNLDLLKSYLKR